MKPRPLDAYPVGNMINPRADELARKRWEAVYKTTPVMLEDFREREVPPVIQRYQEPMTMPELGDFYD